MADVAPSTVSRHINGHRVRRAEAIDAAIEQLGFRASASARSLRSGSTQAIAMIVPDIQNPYYAATVAGAEAVGRQNGLRLFLCNTDEDLELEREMLADVTRRVDGVILVPASESSSTEPFERTDAIPLVLMDRETRGELRFDTVVIDNYGGGATAAQHLLDLGHRDVAVLSGPLTASQGRAREQGFLDTFADAGYPLAQNRLERGDFREEGGYQAALNLLTARERPTALFVINNMMSVGAIRAIRDVKLDVPNDLSLVCFDQLPMQSILSPRITYISRPMHEQGAMAMRMMLTRLRSSEEGAAPRRLQMPIDLVVGASTKPLRSLRAGLGETDTIPT
jgi:LacI family transcriptional regulator